MIATIRAKFRLSFPLRAAFLFLFAAAGFSQQPGAVDPNFGESLGLLYNIDVVRPQADGKVVVGGRFRRHLARLNADGSLDGGFNPALNGAVYALALQGDGRILVGGDFTQAGGAPHGALCRLNADGSVDGTFNPSFDFAVSVIVLQPDGKILVGGSFTQVGDVPRARLARLNADGSLDGGFNPALNGAVYALALQGDGRILVGGDFTQAGGAPHGALCRLNADGSADGTFNPNLDDPSGLVLAAQPDGKILLGGGFTRVNGVARAYCARLNANGTLDDAYRPGFDGSVSTLVLQPDGKVIAGGYFISAAGTAREHLARLGSDGSLDAAFVAGANGPVSSLARQDDGQLVVAGGFTKINQASRNGLARLAAAGPLDAAFLPDQTSGPNSIVSRLFRLPTGKILIEGDFSQFNAATRPYFARLNADGSSDEGYGLDVNGFVTVLAAQADGRLLIGGDFSQVNGVARGSFARLNGDGTLDPSLSVRFNRDVYAIAVQPDGKIVVGGNFTAANGVARASLARLRADGTLDDSFNLGFSESVYTLALQADGKVLVGGYFTQIGGAARSHLARVNADGTLDAAFDLGINGFVSTIVIQPDGKVLIGGDFTQVNGAAHARLARLNADGSVDATFQPQFNSSVYQVAVQADGKILAGGYFTQVSGVARDNLVRLGADGAPDLAFAPSFNGFVFRFVLLPDGKVLAGGDFTRVNGLVRNYVAQLNADGSTDAGFVPGSVSASVRALALKPDDGRVFIGGDFRTAGGSPGNALVRLRPDGSFDPGFDAGLAPGDRVDALARDAGTGDVLAAGVFTAIPQRPGLSAANNGVTNLILRFGSGGRLVRPAGDGVMTDAFSSQAGANGPIYALASLPDGRVLVGGAFTELNGGPSAGGGTRANLGRLTAAGDLDSSFVAGANGPVRAVAVQPDGRILAGGDFTQASAGASGGARVRLARFLPDGNLDGSFNPPGGPNDSVLAIKMQPDGRILISGSFTAVQGAPRGGVARLNADGTLDSSFAAPSLAASGSSLPMIKALDSQLDGKVIIGGQFTAIGGTSKRNVARLDANGQLDPSFNTGAGPDALVNAVKIQTDGKALLGGDFRQVDTSVRSATVRLLGDDVGTGSGPPVLVASPAARFGATIGDQVTLSVTVSGAPPFSYQWFRNGVAIPGATAASYTVASAQVSDAGSYVCQISNALGSVTTAPSVLAVGPAARLINVATRARVGSGDDVLIGGFVVQGTGTKRILMRALAPSLAGAVPGTLADPALRVVDASGRTVGENDNWRSSADGGAAVQATGLAPTRDAEAAIVLALPAGVGYTAIVSGVAGQEGVALVEAYDLEPSATNARLINLATRARVQSGDNVMIAGIVVGGEAGQRRRVLVRALGPSLSAAGVPGVLANPRVDVFNSQGQLLGSNQDWLTQTVSGSTVAEIRSLSLAPVDSRESVLILTLRPGGYTAIVRGADGGVGNALVEAYELP